jgi:flagellar biosynthesis protein FlhA
MPGLPALPFLALAAGLWLAASVVARRRTAEAPAPAAPGTDEAAARRPVEPLDLLAIEVGYNLIPLVDAAQGGDLLDRIKALRRSLADELGFVIPPVRVRDNLELRPNAYTVRLKGLPIGQGEVYPGRYLAMNPGGATGDLAGLEVREPTFGVPATWVAAADRDQARALGYTVVDATTVVATHLSELVRRSAPALLTRQAVQELLDGVKATTPACLDGLIPGLLPLGSVHKVLQLLLAEEVSIRDLPTILEALADGAQHTKDPQALTEWVRAGVAASVVRPYLDDRHTLAPLVLRPAAERVLRQALRPGEGAPALALDPGEARALVDAVGQALARRGATPARPALLVAQDLRPHVRRLFEPAMPHLGVLSVAEIPRTVTLGPSIAVEVPSHAT